MYSHNFPSDLFPDILSRLPTKTLLKFKSVSKLWLSIIEDHKFSSMHAKRLLDFSSRTQICLREHVDGDKYVNKICEIKCNRDVDGDIEEFRPLPEEILNKRVRFVGSSNGVLCLFCVDSETVFLWNPLSTKFQRLPPMFLYSLPISVADASSNPHFLYTLGFGYDKVNDDYKVLCFRRYCDSCSRHTSMHHATIYSHKLKTWRSIDKFPIPLEAFEPGVFFSGSLHWISKGDYSLIVFDLSNEQFKSFKLSLQAPSRVMTLQDGHFYHIVKTVNGVHVFQILLDYKTKSSLKLAVDNNYFWSLKPIAYVMEPREVLVMYHSRHGDSRLVFYDFEKQVITKFDDSNDENLFLGDVFPYIQTLEFY